MYVPRKKWGGKIENAARFMFVSGVMVLEQKCVNYSVIMKNSYKKKIKN